MNRYLLISNDDDDAVAVICVVSPSTVQNYLQTVSCGDRMFCRFCKLSGARTHDVSILAAIIDNM